MKTPSASTALALTALLLFSGFGSPMPAKEFPAPRGVVIDAADPRLRYDGRIDFSDRAAPVLVWQGTRVVLEFTGESLTLRFARADGQNCFDATIDGAQHLVVLKAGEAQPTWTAEKLGPGRHRLELFKRTEAAAGSVRFAGITLAPGAEAFAPPPAPATRWMFFGDSITAGACNEDGAADQWEDRSTHNNARSYAALTAAAFPVDYRNIAISGMGVCEGYVDIKAGGAWDRFLPRADSPRADHDVVAWKPDVLFVNLGENDDSFTRNARRPFPADFAKDYVALVRAMRAAWPDAQVVLLRGGMFGGAKSEPLRRAWESAVAELERSDPRVTHFVFQHWSGTHPRVTDTQAMAAELTAWLRTQPFAPAGDGVR